MAWGSLTPAARRVFSFFSDTVTSSPTRVFLSLLLLRAINAFLCQTYFQPDEFYQSLEIAHRLVFGYGYTSWEWRPEIDGEGAGGIRSPLHPLLFVSGYWILKTLGLDQTSLLIVVPKMLQATIAAAGDFSLLRLGDRLFGPTIGRLAVFCSLSSAYNLYTAVRTFSNSTEASLTTAALLWWPWDSHSYASPRMLAHIQVSLLLAGMACVMRPSNAVIWIVLLFSLLSKVRAMKEIRALAMAVAQIFVVVCGGCLMIDSWFYGTLTFTPWNFFRQNILHGISVFYGVNPWHFYATQAFPVVTFTLLPFVVHGAFVPLRRALMAHHRSVLLRACLVLVLVFSILSHKEFRFIQPLLPIFHTLAALSLSSQISKSRGSPKPFLPSSFWIATVPSLALAIYALRCHGSGQILVTQAIRDAPDIDSKGVGFLMPCHSTPWQSHIHREALDTRAWFLTCEPPINGSDHFLDEADEFYLDPIGFLTQCFPPVVDKAFPPPLLPLFGPAIASHAPSLPDRTQYQWPGYLVVFEVLLDRIDDERNRTIGEFLFSRGYSIHQTIWNSHAHEDPRRDGKLVLLSHDS